MWLTLKEPTSLIYILTSVSYVLGLPQTLLNEGLIKVDNFGVNEGLIKVGNFGVLKVIVFGQLC